MRSFAKGRAGSAGASEEQVSVVQGALGCGGFHRILVSGTVKASFSGLAPALGHEDALHLSRKDFVFQCLVTTLISHQAASQPWLACRSSDGVLTT